MPTDPWSMATRPIATHSITHEALMNAAAVGMHDGHRAVRPVFKSRIRALLPTSTVTIMERIRAMKTLVPNRFLFDFEFPLPYCAKPPALNGRLEGWTEQQRLPRLGVIDDQPEFAVIHACWNETGLFVACQVVGRTDPPRCDPKRYWDSDVLRVCVNTRPTEGVRRATRFCRQAFFMPLGGGAKQGEPACGFASFQRAREEPPAASPDRLRVAANITSSGYTLEGFIAADALNGLDPIDHPRIGFFVTIEDHQLGKQVLTVGDELLWYVDPTTWATAVLCPAQAVSTPKR